MPSKSPNKVVVLKAHSLDEPYKQARLGLLRGSRHENETMVFAAARDRSAIAPLDDVLLPYGLHVAYTAVTADVAREGCVVGRDVAAPCSSRRLRCPALTRRRSCLFVGVAVAAAVVAAAVPAAAAAATAAAAAAVATVAVATVATPNESRGQMRRRILCAWRKSFVRA